MNNTGTILILCCIVVETATVKLKAQVDSLLHEKNKSGFSFGALPVAGYNSDIGFQYGGVVNIFQYGNGSMYPEYRYSLYTEVSRTSKGGGINQVFFDSKYLLPGKLRITADLSFLTELALDFYGFNGYQAIYNHAYENDNDPQYISRVYYKHERKFLRMTADLQGRLKGKHWLWLGGLGYFNLKTAPVDIDRLNKGKHDNEKLPDTALLFEQYIESGIIKEDEKDGGRLPFIKTGVIFDSRDNEPNPMKGIWSELLLFAACPMEAGSPYSFIKIAVTHRQYFTLARDVLNLACRFGYQGALAGEIPFFMQPFMIQSFAKVTTTDGLGGAKTLRGVLRNRVVGDGIAYGNVELRWKFLRRIWWNQNIYLAANAFTDAGVVVNKINIENGPFANLDISVSESLHPASGFGFRFVMNQNFIVAADYGLAWDKRDGRNGLYVGIGFLY
ncbi:MAG: BamA/TamA family outer membrane protein [Bacteroidales bacterium]|nr:BamA/TamA family outer membrane protein [Bacteroidales bacterium]